METVVVTGGAGFIGSHLCERLLKDGFKVVCIDNLLTGLEKNIEHLKSNTNFIFERLDITWEWKNFGDINYMFHLASPASPVDYWNFPEQTAEVNSMGTIGMLKQARNSHAKFLLASTSEVYGDPLEHPQKETYFGNVNSFGPRSCYDESKRFAETYTYIYLHKYDLDARVVRIFNTYGPRMKKDDGRVVSNFVNAAISGETLKIDGDGSQTRSFCYVDDLVGGLLKSMFSPDTKGEIFNLGNPNEFTIKDLAEKILQLTENKSQIEYSGNFRENDPMRRKPDITKAKSRLGWEPETDLTDGLQKTIEYYKSV
jgi:nucleoside-diphosphate-sugar epimerase